MRRAYTRTAIALHWLTAAAIALVVALGLRMTEVGGSERERALTLHMSIGIAILMLTVLRIGWRATHRPAGLATSAAWEKRAAATTHALFYVMLVAVPAIGWLSVASSSASPPAPLLGFLPWPGAPLGSRSLGEGAGTTHRVLAYGLCVLVSIHTVAAIWHHLKNADHGLVRILPGARRLFGWQTIAMVAALVALFALPSALSLIDGGARTRPLVTLDPRKAPVFASVMQPILDEKCADCHGARSQKGGLRLDTFAAVMRGGDSGKVVVPGKADESELVRRIIAPPSHEDAMPPSDRPALTLAQGQLLLWWIDRGAEEAVTIRAASPTPLVEGILRTMGVSSESPALARSVAAPDPAALAKLREAFQAHVLFAGSGLLEVQRRFDRDGEEPVPLDQLATFAEQLVWLDLSGVQASPKQLEVLASLRNLQRLNLASTQATDQTVRALRDLPYLETLNLYGSAVTDAALASLARMPALGTVYLDATPVTAAAIERFRASHPQIQVVRQPAAVAQRLPADRS